ncbi:MAG: hypothetical protein Fur0023_18170 [Bacteroidia bacterium]
MRLNIYFILLAIIHYSCQLEKRLYRKGWHIEHILPANKHHQCTKHTQYTSTEVSYTCRNDIHVNNNDEKFTTLKNDYKMTHKQSSVTFDISKSMFKHKNVLYSKPLSVVNIQRYSNNILNETDTIQEKDKADDVQKLNRKAWIWSSVNLLLNVIVFADFYVSGFLGSIFSPYSIGADFILGLFLMFVAIPVYIITLIKNVKAKRQYEKSSKERKMANVRLIVSLFVNYLTGWFLITTVSISFTYTGFWIFIGILALLLAGILYLVFK